MPRGAFRIGLMMAPIVALLGFAIYAAWTAWHIGGPVEIGRAAVIALVIGVIATLALTAALVWLLIFSERHGYDR